MNVSGNFRTTASPAALFALHRAPERLTGVTSFADLERAGDDTVRVVFSPRTPLGRIPLTTAIAIDDASPDGARVRVKAVRGAQAVDVDLTLALSETDDGTDVRWNADVRVGGVAASVGQRVIGDLARRAIDDVLRSTADLAAGEA